NFTLVAEELIVHTYFFSTTRDVLPKAVSLPHLPAVVIFKDGTFITFSGEHDGDLKKWINRERFPNFFHIDSFTLYSMGDSDKLVLLVLIEKNLCDASLRYKNLLEKVAAEHGEPYSRSFSFGFMEDTDFVTGLLMSEVIVPSFIALNLSNDGYFLPFGAIETDRQLLDFMDGVLAGSVECQGGNSVVQRFRRFVFDIKAILKPLFIEAPLFGCLLFAFPVTLGTIFIYICCTSRSSDDDDDDDDGAILAPSLQQRRKYPTDKKSD
ncbi:protein disulfide-isomerase TMX3-like, partial [Gouania willdenowi]|uniref:protein disulfide-isomerase TMX3-like n=1 Tax=Gouania willdenowi TaxID=441366 RepID=UPI0010563483